MLTVAVTTARTRSESIYYQPYLVTMPITSHRPPPINPQVQNFVQEYLQARTDLTIDRQDNSGVAHGIARM